MAISVKKTTEVKTQKSNLTEVRGNTTESDELKKKKSQNFNYIIYAVGALFALMIIGLLISTFMANSREQKADAMRLQQAKEAQVASVATPTTTDRPAYLASFDGNPQGWYFQPQPLQALVDERVQRVVDSSQYNQNGSLVSPSGVKIPVGSSDYMALVTNLKNNSLMEEQKNYRTEPKGPYQQLYHKDAVSGEFVPMTDPNQVRAMETELDNYVQTQLTQAMSAIPIPSPKEETKPEVINMADEQRQKYLSLIETQRDWNRRLQMENNDLKKRMAEQERTVGKVFQRLEDSPTANNKLRATALPKSTGLKEVAVVGNRVWVADKNGDLYSLEIGSIVPNTQLKVAEINSETGLIMVTPK